jgi:hypothetical protein
MKRIKKMITTRAVIIALTLAYLILARIYLQYYNPGINANGIVIEVPYGPILISFSLYIFYESNRLRKLKREERLEGWKQRRQELFYAFFKSLNK